MEPHLISDPMKDDDKWPVVTEHHFATFPLNLLIIMVLFLFPSWFLFVHISQRLVFKFELLTYFFWGGLKKYTLAKNCMFSFR